MKAKSLGIIAQDYENDKVSDIDDLYKGITIMEGVDQGL
jgi:predicted ribonuclease YlaK